MVWNEAATEVSRSVLREMGIPFTDTEECQSSDIGNISHQCPALHLCLAMGDTYYPEHSVQIADAVKNKAIEPVIAQGAEIMGRIVFKLLENEGLRRAVQEDFKKHTL